MNNYEIKYGVSDKDAPILYHDVQPKNEKYDSFDDAVDCYNSVPKRDDGIWIVSLVMNGKTIKTKRTSF